MNQIRALIACTMSFAGVYAHAGEITVDDSPFAVVELFTSEGCSSCPPADALLRRLNQQASDDGSRVITLAYHVDYWDRLGWPDRFSSDTYTQRQRRYAQVFGNRSIYTPQMVVNGKTEFVGSKSGAAAQAIDRALDVASSVGLGIEVVDTDDQEISISWRVTQPRENTTLLVALVQDDLVTQVQRGENAGRELKHDGVVLQLTAIDIQDSSSTATITRPSLEDVQTSRVVTFVQDNLNMQILAATQVYLAEDQQ